MAEKAKLLAFAGSTRTDSYNKKLIKVAVEQARDLGADVTLIDLRDYPLPIYDGDLEDRQGLPDNGRKLKDLFFEHDGFLISSPEYNSSISGVLKNVIDWVSRPAPNEKPLQGFTGKTAALLAASPGYLGGLRGLVTLRSILGNLGVIVLPTQFALSKADQAFNERGELKEAKSLKAVRNVVQPLVRVTIQLKAREYAEV